MANSMVRNTRQREAIRRVIEEAGRPLGPHEIHVEAQRQVPRLGIATVYRTINALIEDQVIVPVPIPGGPPRYEARVAAETHHHHFLCQHCGRLFDISGCPGELTSLIPPGFELSGHDLLLRGTCAACVTQHRQTNSSSRPVEKNDCRSQARNCQHDPTSGDTCEPQNVSESRSSGSCSTLHTAGAE